VANPKTVEIAVVTRTYQGLEGNRVFAGTRFAVGKPQGDLAVITLPRYNQLKENKLVRPFGEEDGGAVPARARYSPGPTSTRLVEGEGTGVKIARNVRERTRSRLRQEENPGAPKPLNPPAVRAGSQTGEEKRASSLLGDQAQKPSTSGSRGRRTAKPAAKASPSSSSTTPGR
jgi:hypothetical protein